VDFLPQASPPEVRGLQALNRAGAWVDFPVVSGSLVVNIGQAFEVVTNGVCRATTLRVVMSTVGESGQPRKSAIVFLYFTAFGETWREMKRSTRCRSISAASAPGLAGMKMHRGWRRFLLGKYDTWGESQLRTQVRSHHVVGRRFYADVLDEFMSDDA
jgi:hypothetical protein